MSSVAHSSYWNATTAGPGFPQLHGEVEVDVVIVGGGIVGVTTARMLKDVGLTAAVVEAREVGRQVTGKSTAKVTSQHGAIYQRLEQKFGENGARLYAEAQEAGLQKIKELTAEHRIDCALEPADAYIYTCSEKHVGQLEKEAEIAKRLRLPASFVHETDLPFDVLAAVRFADQAQFHPTKYVAGLAASLPGNGSHVFERSRVVDWNPGCVHTEGGAVKARHVVMATHLPLGQVGGYFARAVPYAEPVVAARIGHVPTGMYLNVENPRHSIRTHRDSNGVVFAIAAGTSFKPGHTEDEQKHFADLERWLLEKFDAAPPDFRWVNEDYTSLDEAPFIGRSSSGDDCYLVATGFGAWGITNGTAAGMILKDIVIGKENRWLELFHADRSDRLRGAVQFVKENLESVKGIVGSVLSPKPKSMDELSLGEAAILKIDGEHVAVFKDESGQVHAVSGSCTHMGCELGWNSTDRTWDCGCHGSRFEVSGAVLHGPATTPLETKDVS